MTKKKTLLGIAGLVVAAVAVTAAFAYFSGAGSTATTRHTGSAPNLTVTASSDGIDKYPGDTFGVDLTVSNNSGHASGVGVIRLTDVTGPGNTALAPGCEASWFTAPEINGADGYPNAALANGASRAYTAQVTFEDTGLPQDGCTSQDVELHFSVTPS